jgi:hypothetical protein
MNIMLDLETLSSRPDAAIISIGACTFSDQGPSDETPRKTFYRIVSASSAQACGGRIDAGTVAWWARQSDAARSILNDDDAMSIHSALDAFDAFIASCGAGARVWGNGASFDNVVLRESYQRLGRKEPWKYTDERCYRTLKKLRPDIGPLARAGVEHNAVDDARTQARHAELIFAAMKGGAT